MNEKREWINTIISFLMLIAMLVGLFIVNDVNVNLKEINAEKVLSPQYVLQTPNGSVASTFRGEEDGDTIITLEN